jgi:S1-C subfamily serine protease
MTRLSFKQISALPLFLLFFGTLLTAQSYHSTPCEVFIGVETSPIDRGLMVDKTLVNTPAQISGIKPGDVIVAMDGAAVLSHSQLLQARDKHQQGEAFTLTIQREGVEKTIQARFKSCSAEELETAKQQKKNSYAQSEIQAEDWQKHFLLGFKNFEMSERPILGVYENTDVNVSGVAIGTVLEGKGAQAAGLKAGDVVVKIDGKTITGGSSLRTALSNHKPGDRVSLVYQRDGKTIQTQTVLSADRGYFTQSVERDPCKVFIGVYTSQQGQDRGLRVDGVIDNTPAKEGAVQPGDIILAFNGLAVNTYDELTSERDKKKPGDAFQLTVLRDGRQMTIKARFKPCETSDNAPVEETVEVIQEVSKLESRETPKTAENPLRLELFEAFPNPTYGMLNIKFEAEAIPTTVRIIDISGRVVYSKNLPQFGGSFNEQANLSSQKAGNYVLNIEQGGKVYTKAVLLLPRA